MPISREVEGIGQAFQDSLVTCPWCGAQQDLFLEPPVDRPEQEYFEECSTCGEDFRVAIDWLADGSPRIRIDRGGENE
jgi:transcription elongation factor Elf1